MTLATIIETLKMIALKHPNVNSAYEGNIYEILNAKPDNKYASVVITQQSHTTDEIYDHYGFVIFYVDRLVDDMEENRVQIQSIGKSMLGNIITAFCNEFEAECDNITYQPFTQKFVDETCGVYCTITIDTVKDVYCAERYWDESWSAPVTVIHNQDKRVTFTENGTYTIDYDPQIYTGLGVVEVDVNVDVDSYYNNGYNQGKTDGVNEQKGKLESINITENGTYTKEDGYNEIVVNVPDLNGSYNEGYEQGKADGINEQKSKLESISITENGVYSKEDGYNHIEVNVPDLNGSYDEGYAQGKTDGEQEGYNTGYNKGQADVAANARVLDVTENGVYMSKFSDPILIGNITGVYNDGSRFNNYAELNRKVFNTNIPAAKDSRIELWWKNDSGYKTYAAIIGAQTTEGFIFKLAEYSRNTYRIEYGNHMNGKLFEHNFTYDMTSRWNHIIFSKQDGLYVNDELICNVQGEEWSGNETIPNFWINAVFSEELNNNANGTFGMIKINDVVIIPTADGFQNVNTGELLEVVQDGSYVYSEGQIKYGEGELYKTINVNVVPKINAKEAGLRLGYSTFTEIPEWVDFNGVTDMTRMFSDCVHLKAITMIDTSNVSSMYYMFSNCTSLQTIPLLNTSNVTNMSYMFGNCSNLQTIPLLNTSNVTNMRFMFGNCNKLQTIPSIDTSNVTDMNQMFYLFGGMKNLISLPKFNCQKVTNINQYFSYYADGTSALTDVGGWENLKCDWNDRYGLASCPNLTYQSCINILNGLYDFVGNGESTTKTLKVHPNFLTTVGDKISIGTSRGWTITA